MIKLNEVTYGYRKNRPVFNQLSASFSKGHIYGLLGKNGAGKSTLLRLVAGLLHPSSGEAVAAGISTSLRSPALLQQLLYIPEEVYLPALSFRHYEQLYGAFYPSFSAEQFRSYLEDFEITTTGMVNECSYGQQKKIFISFALACNVNYLLMDEPTNGMDIPSKKQFRKVLSGYLSDERLIIISSHQVRDLDNLMDVLVIVDDSRILLQQPTAALEHKLYFTRAKELAGNNLLYSEPVMGGHDMILYNDGSLGHSPLDTEKLFNAVLAAPQSFGNLFTQS